MASAEDPEVYWIIPGKLAGRPGPGYRPWALPVLRGMGFGTIVTLDPRGVDGAEIEAEGMKHVPMPTEDFSAPDPDLMERFCRLVDAENGAGRAVLTCCFAGRGRTGTLLAAYLIWKGASSGEAMAAVRRCKAKAVEAPEQEEALARFEARAAGRRPRASPGPPARGG